MTGLITEQEISGKMIDYNMLFLGAAEEVLKDALALTDVDTGFAWEGESLSGVKGCAIRVEEGAVLVVEGTIDASGRSAVWVITTGDEQRIVRLVHSEETGMHSPQQLPEDPQPALSEVSRIQDVMNGCKFSEGAIFPTL